MTSSRSNAAQDEPLAYDACTPAQQARRDLAVMAADADAAVVRFLGYSASNRVGDVVWAFATAAECLCLVTKVIDRAHDAAGGYPDLVLYGVLWPPESPAWRERLELLA